MLVSLVLVNLFFMLIKSTEETDGLNEERSFYLYTTEKINKIKYFSPRDDEGHEIVLPEEICLLSYKDIDIGDLDIPDFMVSHIYKISYKTIPGDLSKIFLFKYGDTPIIVIDIVENNEMMFYKNYSSDNTESANLQEMVFERERLGTIFNEFSIYVIEENALLFDKLKMNLMCFEALYRLEKMKKKMDLIISAFQCRLNSLNKSYMASIFKNADWSSIYNCLLSFNFLISSFFADVINVAFELHDIDDDCVSCYNEKEIMKILNQKVDDISSLNSVITFCCRLFDSVKLSSSFLVESGIESNQIVNIPIREIKKAYDVVKKIYSNHDVIKLFPKIKSSINDDNVECYRPISEILSYFLKLVAMFEFFIKKIKSNEGELPQGKHYYRPQRDLDKFKFIIKRDFNNFPSLNYGDYKNFEFIKGHTIETMIKDFKKIKILFNSLVDTLNKRSIEMLEFYEITTNFKNNVLNFKESVIRFKNIIDYIIFGINFRKKVFINELISVSNENNKPGPSSAV